MVTPLVQLSAGSVFAGDFRVIRGLSEGGMGAVYVVEQSSTGKQRALKVMHPQLVHDEVLRQRFVQEARIGARIESEHVVDVIAAGIDSATQMPWLVMELLNGETLGDRVDTMGARPIPEVREVVSQLGHALAAAHKVGIVHRDLKPENVFLATPRREGVPFVVKVLDFGIAKLMAEADVRQTAAIGSPLWMAPEQAEVGGSIQPSTDVWSLGLLVFWMITGREFWLSGNLETPSPMTVLTEMKIDRIPTATERAAEYGVERLLPPNFNGWFARTVNRDMSARFADGHAARRAFETMLGPKPRTKPPSGLPTPTPTPMPTPTLASNARPQAVPDLDIAPRNPSGMRAAVTVPDLGAAPGPVRSVSNPRMPAVSSGTSNPRMAAVSVPLITEIDDDDDPFERLGAAPPPSSPNPIVAPRASAISSARNPIVTTNSGTSSPRLPAVALPPNADATAAAERHAALRGPAMLDPTRGLPGWLQYAALGIVAIGGVWLALRLVLGAAERSRRESNAAASANVVPVTPPLECPKGTILLTGGSFESASGKVQVESFCMDKTEVTVKAYASCVADGHCTTAFAEGNWPASNAEQEAVYDKSCNGDRVEKMNDPVNCVDATQAQAYCSAHDMQLPTEEQWEWAARGKNDRFPYPWGRDAPDNHLCWSQLTARSGTCKVGEFAKGDDPWGVQDLDGNVREWLRGVPGEKAREYCGSDWTDTHQTLHALGYCSTAVTTARSGFLGFRCVKI